MKSANGNSGSKSKARAKSVPEWLNSPIWSSSSLAPAADPYSAAVGSPPPPPPATATTRPPRPQEPLPPPSEVGPSGSQLEEVDEEQELRGQLLFEFKTTLSKRVLNLGELRRLACFGVPDGAGIRPVVWKLLLGYLPPDRALWAQELEKKRNQYSAHKDELLLNPSEIIRIVEESTVSRKKHSNTERIGPLTRSEVIAGEHPLSLGKSSVWNQYFQESDVLEQIDRDIKRTQPEMPFFSSNSSLAKSNQESLRRILIIFSKLNPGIRYVQGMNEVLAPLFYVFKNDPDLKNSAFAEADTFFCYGELLSAFRDNFCKQLDNSAVGIRSTLTKLSQLLKRHDEELWRHMEVTTKVYPELYAFRWITSLLTREFSFTDCIHIWDTLLGDPEGPQDTLLRICCAMLILARRRLLAGDFTANIQLLQHYPSTKIDHLLHITNKLRGSLST